MTDRTIRELDDAITNEILAHVPELHISEELLNLDEAPSAECDHGFVLTISDDDTGFYRERERVRANSSINVRFALQVQPHEQQDTKHVAYSIEEALFVAVLSTERESLRGVDLRWESTVRDISSVREWYYTDVSLNAQWDRVF